MINAINIMVKHTRGIRMANNHRLLPLLLLLIGRSKDSGGGIGVGGGMATTTPVGRNVGDVESSSTMNNTGASVVVVVVLVIVSAMVGSNDGTDVMNKEGGTLMERNCVGDEDGTAGDDPKDEDGSDGALVVEPGGVTLMICPCTISNMATEYMIIIIIIIIIIRMLLNTNRNDDAVVVSTVGGNEHDTLRSCLEDRKED
jgi:hypothetical protein